VKLCKCRCGTEVGYARTYVPGHQAAVRARWAGHDPNKPSSECRYCDVPMISSVAWRKMSVEHRRTSGLARHGARGLCDRCAKGVRRANDPTRTPGSRSPNRSREEMLEDWDLLRSDGVTDLTVAALRMGVTKGALQKCLERARKAGDPRAVVYRNSDLSGGFLVGTTTNYRTRRAA
jgi:hypothetical protein